MTIYSGFTHWKWWCSIVMSDVSLPEGRPFHDWNRWLGIHPSGGTSHTPLCNQIDRSLMRELGGGPEGPNGPRHVTIFCPTEFVDRMASEKHGRAVLRSSLPAVRDCVLDLKDFGHFGRVGNGYCDWHWRDVLETQGMSETSLETHKPYDFTNWSFGNYLNTKTSQTTANSIDAWWIEIFTPCRSYNGASAMVLVNPFWW